MRISSKVLYTKFYHSHQRDAFKHYGQVIAASALLDDTILILDISFYSWSWQWQQTMIFAGVYFLANHPFRLFRWCPPSCFRRKDLVNTYFIGIECSGEGGMKNLPWRWWTIDNFCWFWFGQIFFFQEEKCCGVSDYF